MRALLLCVPLRPFARDLTKTGRWKYANPQMFQNAEPCAESQQAFAEADVCGIAACKPRKTSGAVKALAKGSGPIQDPSLMRIGRAVAVIERLRESNRDQLI